MEIRDTLEPKVTLDQLVILERLETLAHRDQRDQTAILDQMAEEGLLDTRGYQEQRELREAQAMEGPQGREATKAGMGERALLVR